MKIFNPGGQEKKSWALAFDQGNAALFASAVDSVTGDKIAKLIGFYDDGTVGAVEDAKDTLSKAGYDPHEHGNVFDNKGRLLVRPRVFAYEFGTESADYVAKHDDPNAQVVRYRDLVSVLEG